ncbi:hypothetical protein B0T25DRAFT_623765 [Lasiosphaeria hispida]|uniref:Uncharacterized protein n=1 Tax=Lasiosphaeria hispida TaxID=260671 RepID=A0AAJ0MBZ4_9PEZI|nr:hypothetical protein B0T25DRAFT_623765 [Lasiosphaeria hispida]
MAFSSLVFLMPPLPNKRVNGWETDDSQSVQVSLALPRDGGFALIVPWVLSDNDESVPWPTSSAHMSFAGPVDLDMFHIKEDAWPEMLNKTAVFIKLGSYLLPENDRPPYKGVHVCHVLLLFPLEQQLGLWIVCSGQILGVLNHELIQGPQSALSAHNAPTSAPSNPVPESPTPAWPAGPGGFASRNPFSSPSRGQKVPLPQNVGSPTLETTKHSQPQATEPPASAGGQQTPRDTMTTAIDPVTVLSSNHNVTEHGSDVKQLLDDQLASTSATPIHKRKAPGSPGSGRSKRTTAGKRRAQLYD